MFTGIKKDTREQGGQEKQEKQERQESLFFLSFLFFLFFLSFLSFLSGAPRPQSVDSGRLADTLLLFIGRPSRPFSLPLLVAKVAQKPRTTSLAETRVAKPKTNATRVKRLPSLFLNGFATLASRDRQVGRFPADDAKCGF